MLCGDEGSPRGVSWVMAIGFALKYNGYPKVGLNSTIPVIKIRLNSTVLFSKWD